VLAGLGSGMFPLTLTMFGLHTRTPAATAALSAFSQCLGYVIAGCGPLLVGLLLGPHENWTGPFVVLYVALAVAMITGWIVARPHFVDDELPRARAAPTAA